MRAVYDRFMLKLSYITLACFLSLILSQAGFAEPWFTGPLLAPPAKTVDRGHINAFFLTTNAEGNSVYNSDWQRVSQVPYISTQISPQFIYGLTDNVDIEYTALYEMNQKKETHYEHLGDTSIGLGFQALSQEKNKAMPDLRITLEEVLPSGFYNQFSVVNAGVESTGMGSYQTSLGFNFQYVSQLDETHYLDSHLSLTYTYVSTTDIHGLSSYGGTPLTSGRIHPGNAFSLDWAEELTLTQHWGAVMEVNYIYQQASSFHGVVGTINPTDSILIRKLFPNKHNIGKSDVGSGTLDQISLAPALEYNFSKNFGVISGVWFTVAGKNTPQFIAPVFQFTATW